MLWLFQRAIFSIKQKAKYFNILYLVKGILKIINKQKNLKTKQITFSVKLKNKSQWSLNWFMKYPERERNIKIT